MGSALEGSIEKAVEIIRGALEGAGIEASGVSGHSQDLEVLGGSIGVSSRGKGFFYSQVPWDLSVSIIPAAILRFDSRIKKFKRISHEFRGEGSLRALLPKIIDKVKVLGEALKVEMAARKSAEGREAASEVEGARQEALARHELGDLYPQRDYCAVLRKEDDTYTLNINFDRSGLSLEKVKAILAVLKE